MNITFENYGTKVTIAMDQDSDMEAVLRCVVGIMVTLGYNHGGILETMNDLAIELKPIEK